MMQSVNSTSMVQDDSRQVEWESGLAMISRPVTYWLATSDPEGRPHVVPVLAVLANGQMHVSTSYRTRKGQNLKMNPRCVLSCHSGDFDLSLEGRVRQVVDLDELQRVADAYQEKYGWQVTVRDGAFHDADGAPTAGPPPYAVFAIEPDRAFAFGTDEETNDVSTRWHFS